VSERLDLPGRISTDRYYEGMNPHERRVARPLIESGFRVLRRGWPDFFVYRTKASGALETAFLVEVKSEKDCVTPDQKLMHRLLSWHGLRTHVVREPIPDIPSLTRHVIYEEMGVGSVSDQLDALRAEVSWAGTIKARFDRLERRVVELRSYLTVDELDFGGPSSTGDDSR